MNTSPETKREQYEVETKEQLGFMPSALSSLSDAALEVLCVDAERQQKEMADDEPGKIALTAGLMLAYEEVIKRKAKALQIDPKSLLPLPTNPRELIQALQTVVAMERVFEEYKAFLKEREEAIAYLATILAEGLAFEDSEGTVYRLVKPGGHYVFYRKVDVERTKRAGERSGSISMKDADALRASGRVIRVPPPEADFSQAKAVESAIQKAAQVDEAQ